jgi:hypothetical protein
MIPKLTGNQFRAGRALAGLTRDDLATRAGLSRDVLCAPRRFRTIQVCPKNAARKHVQALALSNGHIPRLWQQRAFLESVKKNEQQDLACPAGLNPL